MKIPTHEAAVRLGVHPAQVVLWLCTMVESLSDCWPDVEEGFVETLRSMGCAASVRDHAGDGTRGVSPTSAALTISADAAKILDKLERHGKWGKITISVDTIRNHYCRDMGAVFDGALEELVEGSYLTRSGGKRGVYSLNPSRKRDILAAVEALRP